MARVAAPPRRQPPPDELPVARVAQFTRFTRADHPHHPQTPAEPGRWRPDQLAVMTPLGRKLLGVDPW